MSLKVSAKSNIDLETYFAVTIATEKGGVVASWLVRSFPDRAVQVRALAGSTVMCSWAGHFTLAVSLSTQEYKWVPANCWRNRASRGGVTCDELGSRPGGVEILLATLCYRNRDKLRQL